MIDLLIPDKYLKAFNKEKKKFSNKIFNYILISEFILLHQSLRDIIEKNQEGLKFDKFDLYIEAINLSLNYSAKRDWTHINDEKNEIRIPITKFLTSVSELYCMVDRNRCEENIISWISIKRLKNILTKMIFNRKLNDNIN